MASAVKLRQVFPHPATISTSPHNQEEVLHNHEKPQHNLHNQLASLYDSGALGGKTPDMRVQANFVSSLDGRIAGADDSSRSLSSPADKHILILLRYLCDALVIGAKTAQSEAYRQLRPPPHIQEQRRARGQQPRPLLVVVSGSGVVNTDILREPDAQHVVIHTQSTDPTVLENLRSICDEENIRVHRETITPAHVLGDLSRRGAKRVLVEGGPGLMGDWLEEGLIDELCLTISPLIMGIAPSVPSPPVSTADIQLHDPPPPAAFSGQAHLTPPIGARPLSVLTDEKNFFFRWALNRKTG